MRIHYIPQWLPPTFEPTRKPAKARKQFYSEDATETPAEASTPRPSDILDEDEEAQHTDILA